MRATGKPISPAPPTTAALKVSFFGPFYGGYNVIRLDDDYQYALVSGPNRDYLWILSRHPHHSGGGEAGLPEYRARAGL